MSRPHLPPAKRRRRNRTLKDYFPPLLKQKPDSIGSDENLHNALLVCPADILNRCIFPQLTVQDLTAFSATCHRASSLVDSFRGPLPHIVKEELLPVQMLFAYSVWGSTFDIYNVSRLQTVRFLLKTKSRRIVEVNFDLGILLWTEGSYFRNYIDHGSGQQRTWIETTMSRQLKHPRGSRTWKRVYESTVDYVSGSAAEYNLDTDDFHPWMESPDLGETDEMANEMQTLPSPAAEEYERQIVQCFLVCANRIARSPIRYNLPSLQYMIRNGLPLALHRYLPSQLAINWEYSPSPPRNVALWRFRKARSPKVRLQFLKPERTKQVAEGQHLLACEIHKIPWYRRWYPEPRVVRPKLLFQSLPPTLFRNHVLPFLSNGDLKNLNCATGGYLQRVTRGDRRYRFKTLR